MPFWRPPGPGFDKVYGNDKLQPVITALGAGIGDEFDVNKLRYHKVIIMADADFSSRYSSSFSLTTAAVRVRMEALPSLALVWPSNFHVL